ncbi:MAG: hypothetical protein KAT74_05140 [Candidatus Cloacimonetes bacterium]|nr:hypothetical protein [Candidatus Cloacimonadota bacterium]
MLRLKRFNYIIVLLIALLIKCNLLAVWSDTIPGTTLKPSQVPIFGELEIVPDKGVYEKNEIINFNISLRLDREHVSYEPDKIYDIRTSYVTGFESIYGTFEIISSNIDTLFTMDEQNDLVNINTIIQTKKRTNRVGIELDIYRVGFNRGVQDQIVYGQIPENNPEVQWQLNHDRYQKRVFFNTSTGLPPKGAFNLPN